ncbi:MAG: biotin/lipoyl-binding protein, partial [Bryobacterales bacterium]|nr:biotin/lipoyl-binding protein [Bryobacterales bacterium]
MRIAFVIGLLAAVAPAIGQEAGTVRTELTSVVSRSLDETTTIPGELKPYQRVDIYAKVTGFVESVHVDRGSFVKVGQMLAEMSAPELEAQRAEAQAKVPVAAAQRIE